jgi:hypothetical protein
MLFMNESLVQGGEILHWFLCSGGALIVLEIGVLRRRCVAKAPETVKLNAEELTG